MNLTSWFMGTIFYIFNLKFMIKRNIQIDSPVGPKTINKTENLGYTVIRCAWDI